ncbi:hypothetical protein G6M50_06045 [Agrobacterium rhizogenes]|nr:hypothetical protein [Rhizobium rhizogenes]NTJ77363.1 hypothetical protein [Rhizobium rhizogenes]
MKKVLECVDCKASFDHEKIGGQPIRCPSCRLENKRRLGRETARRRREIDPERDKASQQRYRDRNKDKQTKRNKDYYAANTEREKDRAQKWRLENADRCKEVTAKWREENAERFREMQDAWREENAEHLKQYRREQYLFNREEELAKAKEWKAANTDLCAALFMKRKAAKLQATPPWADEKAIRAIYAEARRLTMETGIKHHVDHIYPLQSDWVCGLHIETNLQILTASENHSKSNRRHPDYHPN